MSNTDEGSAMSEHRKQELLRKAADYYRYGERYVDAARLYDEIEEHQWSVSCYHKLAQFRESARILERLGDFRAASCDYFKAGENAEGVRCLRKVASGVEDLWRLLERDEKLIEFKDLLKSEELTDEMVKVALLIINAMCHARQLHGKTHAAKLLRRAIIELPSIPKNSTWETFCERALQVARLIARPDLVSQIFAIKSVARTKAAFERWLEFSVSAIGDSAGIPTNHYSHP